MTYKVIVATYEYIQRDTMDSLFHIAASGCFHTIVFSTVHTLIQYMDHASQLCL